MFFRERLESSLVQRLSRWLASIVLAISLAITFAVWQGSRQAVERQLQAEFDAYVGDMRATLQGRIQSHAQILRDAAALFAVGRVTRDGWHSYITRLKLRENYPALQALEFARSVSADELDKLVRDMRAGGFPEYAVRPPGRRDRYVVGIYAEPAAGMGIHLPGYDMWQDGDWRETMERARIADEPMMTSRKFLKTEEAGNPVPAFMMFQPVFGRTGDEVYGYVLSALSMPVLMRDVFPGSIQSVAVTIHDGVDPRSENLIYSSAAEGRPTNARFVLSETMRIGGRTWTLSYASLPLFEAQGETNRPLLLLTGGLVFSLLLFGLVWSLVRMRLRAEQMAQAMTATLRESEGRFRALYEQAAVGVAELETTTGMFLRTNPHFLEFVGMTAEELQTTTFSALVHPEDRQAHNVDMASLRNGVVHEVSGERRFLREDGSLVWGDLTISSICERGEGAKCHLVVLQNITERKDAEGLLRLSDRVFESSSEGITITDESGRILSVNRSFTEITGYSAEDAIGENPRLLQSGRHNQDFYRQMWGGLCQFGQWQGEIWNRRKNGEIYPEWLSISAVRNSNGVTTHYVGIFGDITERKAADERISFLAYHDSLTQLPNRVKLKDRMNLAMAQTVRREGLVAVCSLDLDRFKSINELYGPETGDLLLIEVSKRLLSAVRAGDTVARLGGDEFVLLVSDLSTITELEQVLLRVQQSLGEPYILDGQEVQLTASIGVAIYPLDDNDTDTLLRHADQSMYAAKQAGRDRFCYHDPVEEQRAHTQFEARSAIQAALQRQEFRLYYQPKVDLRAGHVIGAEALIRWQHPERGLLPPGAFLPEVEDSELIIDIGNWVLHESMRQLQEWRDAGLDFSVSVNVAARQIQHPDFVINLKQLLARHPEIPANQLELEILETNALNDIEATSLIMEECQALGVGFALDDFGTGYSSLAYLKRLPAHTMKVDQSFIMNLLEDPDDLSITHGILSLARAFQRVPIAEGVETSALAVMVLKLGFDLVQGYGIARPMPPNEIPNWVRKFLPDPAWIKAGNTRLDRDDFPILAMEIEHRHWIKKVVAAVESGVASLLPIHVSDPKLCKFGRWYGSDGFVLYRNLVEFKRIAPLHNKVHRIADRMTQLLTGNKPDLARSLIAELLHERDNLLVEMDRLQRAITLEHGSPV